MSNFTQTFWTSKSILLLFYKYRIQLGSINAKQVTKREVKRALIEKLLHVQRPPQCPYASDYFSSVISTRPLYKEFTAKDDPCAYKVPHTGNPRAGKTAPVMDTIFWYEGKIDRERLLGFYNYPGKNPSQNMGRYSPDEYIRSLNVIPRRTSTIPVNFWVAVMESSSTRTVGLMPGSFGVELTSV